MCTSTTVASGVLVVAPHPDDDVLIASGVIYNAIARGDDVKVVYMTNGDIHGVAEGLRRQNEAVAGQVQHLGTIESDLIFLGYPDGGLQTIFASYPNTTDSYVGSNGRSTTYGARGLGSADYRTYRTGVPALYNRPNIVEDLRSVIDTYSPEHIITVSQYDRHSDHAATNALVKMAMNAAIAARPAYNPVLHTTIVWAANAGLPPVWPEHANPSTYHVAPSSLPPALSWAGRESIDVPAAMQSMMLSSNPKYRAIDEHQGGAQSYLGRFVHKDEIFWAESLNGAVPQHVDAGFNQTASAGSSVQLNGTASFNPSGGTLTYSWRQIGGRSVALVGADTATPSFIAPTWLPTDEILNFELVVSESNANTSLPDLVSVTVLADAPSNRNVAPLASIIASTQNAASGQLAVKAVDGVADGYPGDRTREWATQGQRVGAWIEMRWAQSFQINRVVFFDRPNASDHITAGMLTFSDGSSVPVGPLNNDGSGTEVRFASRGITSLRFEVTATSSATANVGLAEMQVYSPFSVNGNRPPVAVAGPHDAVAPNTSVQLDGSASSDPEGAALTYRWRQLSGEAVTLLDATTINPSFIAPAAGSHDKVLTFELVVNDSELDSTPSTVRMTVLAVPQGGVNVAPQALVTASSQNVVTGQLAVKAVDGFIGGYPANRLHEWAAAGQTIGAWIDLQWDTPTTINRVMLYDRPNLNDRITGATLAFSDGSSVPVSALNNDGSGVEVTFSSRTITGLRLTITSMSSSSGNAGLAEFQVFTTPGAGNQPPTANAGSAQTVDQGTHVKLDGSASTDPEGAALTYRWRQIGGIEVLLSNATTATPSFTVPSNLARHESLNFELVVNDGEIDSFAAVVTVTVAGDVATLNLAPQATVSASSQNAPLQLASKAVDGVRSGYPADSRREWASVGERAGAWINLQWSAPIIVDRIVLYDRPNTNDRILGGVLEFSDGSIVTVNALNNDGSATQVNFPPKTTTSVRFTANAVSSSTHNTGLSEFEVFGVDAEAAVSSASR
jgi:LmbE family N-acetylglucosaminyl deacetylase